MSRQAVSIGIAILVAITTSQLQAQVEQYWRGGSGALSDTNYTTNGTDVVAPSANGNILQFGENGVATQSANFGTGRLHVGHNDTSPVSGLNGGATVTINAGALVTLNDGAEGIDDASLWVGNAQNATLNIEQAATLSVTQLVVIGVGSNVNRTGELNVRTGGVLAVNAGDIVMSSASNGTGNGVNSKLTLSDADSIIAITGNAADFDMSSRAAKAEFIQSNGTMTVNDLVQVTTPTSRNTSAATATTFSISGGTFTTGTGGTTPTSTSGNFFVGRGASIGATVNISGTALLNVGHRYLMGGSATTLGPTDPPDPPNLPFGSFASGIVTNHTGGTLNVDNDIRVADAAPSAASDSTYNFSGGTVNTNVAALTTGSTTVIGRQGDGKFIQTGGQANFNSPLSIGNRESATAVTTSGLYKVSAGDLNINAPTSTWTTALSIAPNGTGEFRVVGDDATIDVDGNFAISNTVNGPGTLAFELETGDLLSRINVTGNATFNANSILAFDISNTSPTQTTYDLLTAATIVDSGITFNGPANWDYQIVSGGNGQILQLVQTATPGQPGDHNGDGIVDAADYVAWRKLNIDGEPGYNAFVENFGESTPGGGGNSQVPEPATLLLCCVAACGLASIRRR